MCLLEGVSFSWALHGISRQQAIRFSVIYVYKTKVNLSV